MVKEALLEIFERDLGKLKEEISLYKSLLILETSKKEAILRSNGKHLENFTKQTSAMMDNPFLPTSNPENVDPIFYSLCSHV